MILLAFGNTNQNNTTNTNLFSSGGTNTGFGQSNSGIFGCFIDLLIDYII